MVRSATADRSAVTDRELLRRFARENDQGAFETLVNRHTAMVLGVCRRALSNVQDAEDACQATFLVLANRARDGRWQESVANWLYTTARNVAYTARVATQRRAKREAGAAVPESVEPVDRMTGRELLAVLDEELSKLAPRYREPLVLCYLEGLTLDEAAARLGVPLATLKTRTARGRKQLAGALMRRGCGLGLGLLAVAVSSPVGASPPKLVASILTAAAGHPSAAVGELAKGVAVKGLLTRIKLAVVAVVGLAVMGFGLAAVPPRAVECPPVETSPAPAVNNTKPAPEPVDVKAEKRIEVKGVVLGPDDKPVPEAKLFLIRWGRSVPAPQTVAGKDGTFAFELEENRADSVIATAPGCGIGWAHLYQPAASALTIRLTTDEPITGKVVNLEGKPVAGVTVSVVASAGPGKGTASTRGSKPRAIRRRETHPRSILLRT